MSVRNGLDRLVDEFAERFHGFRVGLVANSASVAADGRVAWDCLREAGCKLTCVFAPEHGARLEYHEGKRFASYHDEDMELEIRSLYDERRLIDSSSFVDVDLVLYDLPQVGCRFYTYVHTLVELMRYGHRTGTPLMVLDRPNPIRADIVEGPIPREQFTTPFGPDRVPVRYGLTMAEFARAYASRHHLDTPLSFMLMEGYERSMWFDETGLPWVPTSPNMRSLDAVSIYPGTCLFEGTTLSEGRGTDWPFELFGAPWLDAEALIGKLRNEELPGLEFAVADFVPSRSKHAGLRCHGLQLRVTDRNSLQPVAAMLTVIGHIRAIHGDVDLWHRDEVSGQYFFDMLLCDEKIRLAIEEGQDLNSVVSRYDTAAELWARERSPFLSYQ